MSAPLSHTCQIDSPANLGMTNCISEIATLANISVAICMKGHRLDTLSWLDVQVTHSVFHIICPTPMPLSVSVCGMPIADSMPGYNMNNTCIKDIKSMYSTKRNSKRTRLNGTNKFLKAKSEASQMKVAVITEPDEEAAEEPVVRHPQSIVAK